MCSSPCDFKHGCDFHCQTPVCLQPWQSSAAESPLDTSSYMPHKYFKHKMFKVYLIISFQIYSFSFMLCPGSWLHHLCHQPLQKSGSNPELSVSPLISISVTKSIDLFLQLSYLPIFSITSAVSISSCNLVVSKFGCPSESPGALWDYSVGSLPQIFWFSRSGVEPRNLFFNKQMILIRRSQVYTSSISCHLSLYNPYFRPALLLK